MAEEPKDSVGGSLLETLKISRKAFQEELRRAAGSAQQENRLILLVYHRDGVVAVPLPDGGRVVVGRFAPADVAVRDRTLSRQHAAFERKGDDIWVEDLGSTNGTWLNGEAISRSKIEPGTEILLGSVTASVHNAGAADATSLGLEGHDQFVAGLAAELSRAREFGRSLALVVARGDKRREAKIGQWFPRVRGLLRPFDRMALYGDDCIEVMLPEAGGRHAAELASSYAKQGAPLLCGVSVFPDHANSADELLEQALGALHRASSDAPVQLARVDVDHGSQSGVDVGMAMPLMHGASTSGLLALVARLAGTSIPVLILGETGVGKEMYARAIHYGGKRKDHPIICMNCGSIPAQLVESTLFGHVRGAFTGADKDAKGVFEAASGGTVLLDEIGELPAAAQAALLRVLETRKVVRVGSTREVEVDVRVLAATHRDLEAMSTEGKFRQDLYYRLNTMMLRVPPLRERSDEIGLLAQAFIEQANRNNECNVQGISQDALALLRRHSWPGNVRELRNAIERAVVIARGSVVTPEDLPEKIRELGAPIDQPSQLAAQEPSSNAEPPDGDPEHAVDLKGELRKREAELIVEMLQRTDWDRVKAAALLGLPVRTLSYRMQALGVRRRDDDSEQPDPGTET